MRKAEDFWWTIMVRGFLALMVGSAIIIIPDMARSLLLLPIALAVAILGLAVYGILDSVLVFITGYMTNSRRASIALRIQGTTGILVGLLLYRVFFDQVRLEWFLILIAVQALITGISEFLVAQHQRSHTTSMWNFAASGVTFLFSCTYFYFGLVLARRLIPKEISWLIFGYLLAFGIAQCLTAARMIHADHCARSVRIESIEQEV